VVQKIISQSRIGWQIEGGEQANHEIGSESEPRGAAVDGRPSGNDAAPPH